MAATRRAPSRPAVVKSARATRKSRAVPKRCRKTVTLSTQRIHNERLPHSSVRPLNFCRNTSCTGYVSRVPDGEKQRERTSQRQCQSAQLCAGLCALSGRIPATIGMWTQSPTHSRHEGSGEKKRLSGMHPRNDRASAAARTTRAEEVAVESKCALATRGKQMRTR